MKKLVLLTTGALYLSTAGCIAQVPRLSENLTSFLYQLQDAEVDEILRSGFKLVVMDYSHDGSDEARYSPDEIARLTGQGITALAYLSIGEAEDYRFYWDDAWDLDHDGTPDHGAPAWLGHSNPDWPGNYKVRYWDPAWQAIVLSYLEKIIVQGFAGVYLDIVDAFEYWSDPGNPEGEVLPVTKAARRMIDFVLLIAVHARAQAPGFLVVPQNAEWILDFDEDEELFAAVSGWGAEDVFYLEEDPTPDEWREERVPYLDRLVAAGKLVLVVDYVDDGTGYHGENLRRIEGFLAAARDRGYVPYAARSDRELDKIVTIPGLQP